MKPWPDNPFLQCYYEPLTTECTAPDLVIEGEIRYGEHVSHFSPAVMSKDGVFRDLDFRE